MPSEFHQKAHETLANANLQLAVFTATGRLKDKRSEVVGIGQLPDYQELRTQAHAVKRHAIDNLDHYLELFERNVAARGGRVVYCKDATEVSDFILALAHERGARLITGSDELPGWIQPQPPEPRPKSQPQPEADGTTEPSVPVDRSHS